MERRISILAPMLLMPAAAYNLPMTNPDAIQGQPVRISGRTRRLHSLHRDDDVYSVANIMSAQKRHPMLRQDYIKSPSRTFTVRHVITPGAGCLIGRTAASV